MSRKTTSCRSQRQLPKHIWIGMTLPDGRSTVVDFIRQHKVAELMTSDDLGPFLRDLYRQSASAKK